MNKPENISLHDYFAAAALQGILASRNDPTENHEGCKLMNHQQRAAFAAYAVADAMMEERERLNDPNRPTS